MKILYTTDIHTSHNHLFSMFSIAGNEAVDGIIVGGDLIPHYLPNEQTRGVLNAQATYLEDIFIPAIKEFRKDRGIPIFLDMANDDFIANRYILKTCHTELFCLLHMEKHPLTEGIDVIGYMNVPPTSFHRKDWEKPDAVGFPFSPGNDINVSGVISSKKTLEPITIDLNSTDTIERDLDQLSKIIENPFIFVSHTPPYKTPLDVIDNGLNVGSLSVRQFIEKWSAKGKLIASLHGHIHESPWRSGSMSTTINNVLCINPGQETGDTSKFRYVIFQLLGTHIQLIKSGGGEDG